MEKYVPLSTELKAKNAKVRQKIKKETNKDLTCGDMRNARLKYSGNVDDIITSLNILHQLETDDPDAFIKIVYVQENETDPKMIKMISVQPSNCTSIFQKYVSVSFIDTTYKLTRRDWSLTLLSVVDNFSDTKLIFWALHPDEQKITLTTL